MVQLVQKCVYMHEGTPDSLILFLIGSVNKLLMDDKGSTLVIVFGLPPLSHQDDSSRAVLMSFLMVSELMRLGVSCSMGVATGTVFTGVIGPSGSRREYSVMGDKVNLAARLMQEACKETESARKVLCCQ